MAPRRKTQAKPQGKKKASKPRKNSGNGNVSTLTACHPYAGLSKAEKDAKNIQDYGFKNLPKVTPGNHLDHQADTFPRQNLPNDEKFATKMMRVMQNKLFWLREYFIIEAKDLILRGIERNKRTKSEQAMLNEAANPEKLLPVSRRAQDCLRLILYYVVIFAKEDMLTRDEEDSDYIYFQMERETNVKNRDFVWNKLKLEIAEHLPGDRKLREQRAEVVLKDVLELVGEQSDKVDVDGDVEMDGGELPRIFSPATSSDYESSDSDEEI